MTTHWGNVFGLWLMGCASAWGAQCTDWPICDLGQAVDLTPVTGFETYVFDSESDHFVIFADPATVNFPLLDPLRLQTLAEQLECGYSYFVCQLGMTAPNVEKTHVYLGDQGSAVGASDHHMRIADAYVTDPIYDHKLHTTPVHEFFHLIQNQGYGAYNGFEYIQEGMASLAEQVVSADNFDFSFVDALRPTMLTQPEYAYSYGLNVFWRYLFEQLAGPPPALGDIDEDWGVADFIEPALLQLNATPGVNIADFVYDFVTLHAVAGVSVETNPSKLVDNFVTMRYGFQHVDATRTCALQDQAKYAYRNTAVLSNVATLDFYSSGNVLNVGDILDLDNTTVQYGLAAINGFPYFLAAEYHELQPDLATVNRLRFTKAVYDEFIRFQVIIRFANGCVLARRVLRGGVVDKTLTLPFKNAIEEIVFVAYTLNYNPISSGEGGNLFTVAIEALP